MSAVGRYGAWIVGRKWPARDGGFAEMAAELESLGFKTIWLGNADGGLQLAQDVLAATQRLTVATGIVNVWAFPAEDVASNHERLVRAYPGRFVLGIGVAHAPFVAHYEKLIAKLESYLDELDSARHPVAPEERVVAALQPRGLRVAAARVAGAHPYLVPPEHTEHAREVLGEGPLLAPEQAVVICDNAHAARATAASSCRCTGVCRTTSTTSAGTGWMMTTSSTVAATGSLTPWWPGAPRTMCDDASRLTFWTRAPTTLRSKCSTQTRLTRIRLRLEKRGGAVAMRRALVPRTPASTATIDRSSSFRKGLT